ncbi:GntR family transcriptional regulator [Roseiterribacter gracilis]|uniref:GntR family transcriptional regulator n=1 Tax=Roseiterribacter gracilis TaxID=2812848 RepID=A0A8S8XF03_9PROT|nr:GntR family transcriptional regulator [Rhodospirillales bacterium TMPK1]
MSAITDNPDAPRYQQVAARLMHEIAEGKPPVGQLLPTEIELCERFDVSRYTVREALRWLAESGLVTRRRGSGTLVVSAAPTRNFIQPLGSLSELLQYARATRLVADRIHRIKLDSDLAERLQATAGDEWVKLSGIRTDPEAGVIICLTDVYLDGRFDGIEHVLHEPTQAIYELIEQRYGLTIVRVEQRLSAVSLTREQSAQLHVGPHVPALRTERRYFDSTGRLVELSDSLHAGDRFIYSMECKRDG